MAKKKIVTHELSASERGVLTKKINQCVDELLKSEHHGGLASALKKEIRATMDAGGLADFQTATAFARIDSKESRKADDDAIAAIKKMVLPADFETICPRRLDLKAFDEVVGHCNYPGLEKVLTVSSTTSFTVGQLAG